MLTVLHLQVQTCPPRVHTFVAVLVGSSSHRSMRSMLIFSGRLPRSMNQPPVDTSVPAFRAGLAMLASLLAAGWSLLGEQLLESGCPFRYRDARELFMWLVGCGWQKGKGKGMVQSHCQNVVNILSDSTTFEKCPCSRESDERVLVSFHWLVQSLYFLIN